MTAVGSAAELAKRQVALLGKMLLYSIDHLTEEDQKVYDSLIEELAPRTEGRADSRARPSSVPQPVTSQSAPDPRATPQRASRSEYKSMPENRKLQGAKPEAVVRLFVECWDKQDFKQEYFCLSDNFKQGRRSQQTIEEYVNSRYDRYANRHLTGPISKQVVDISAPVVDGDLAAVQVAERHIGKGEDMILYRSYDLHFENTAWRIARFTTNQTRVRKRV